MAEKKLITRIINKHDTEANWNKASNFAPKLGELIIYDKDASHPYQRMKVGDGSTIVKNLPFVDNSDVKAQHVSFTDNETFQDKYDKGELTGPKGKDGKSGVEISETQPTDPSIDVWLNTEGELISPEFIQLITDEVIKKLQASGII